MAEVEIPGWVALLSMVLCSGAVVWMVRGYWTNRAKQTDTPTDYRRDYRDILQDERKALQDERAESMKLRVAHKDCEDRLDRVEQDLRACKDAHEECAATTKDLQAQVTELRELAFAGYVKTPTPPKADPRRDE